MSVIVEIIKGICPLQLKNESSGLARRVIRRHAFPPFQQHSGMGDLLGEGWSLPFGGNDLFAIHGRKIEKTITFLGQGKR